jgi:glycine cleavage system aminomethyltransferase T
MTGAPKYTSLQNKIDALGNPAEWLRNVPVGAYLYPVQSEFTNWRDEQRSWRETVGLLDQSLHMTDLYVEGPDTNPALVGCRRQLVQGLRQRQRQAAHLLQPRRLPDWRHDFLWSGRHQGQCGRSTRSGELGHSFAGAPGLEFWGPLADRDEVRNATVEAGAEFGLKLVGGFDRRDFHLQED